MKIVYLFFLFISTYNLCAQNFPIEIKFDVKKMETSNDKLSSFVDSIEYIALETKEECLIGEGMNFDIDDTHIVVTYNLSEFVYLFDRKGHFLRTIGNMGGGPNEYAYIENVFIDPSTDCIVITSVGKALYYSKQGEFLYSIPFPVDERRTISYFNDQFLRMVDSYVFRDSTFHVYTIYNSKGNLMQKSIASIPIPLRKDPERKLSYKCKEINPVYIYQNMPHVREYLNDTIFMINGLSQFIPKYVLDLGDSKVSPDIQADIDHFEERIQEKIIIIDMFETTNSLFFQYFNKWRIHSCRYDKKENKLYKFETEGYPNDCDGGVDYKANNLRKGQRNRFVQTAFPAEDFISALEYKKKLGEKGQRSISKKMQRLINRMNIDDNPVIMIMTLKM